MPWTHFSQNSKYWVDTSAVKTLLASIASRRMVTVVLLCIDFSGPWVQGSKCFLGVWRLPTVPVSVFLMRSSSITQWSTELTLPELRVRLHRCGLHSLYCEAFWLKSSQNGGYGGLLQSFKGVNRLEEVKADAWIHIICTFTQFKAFEIETYDAFSMNPCPFSKSFFNVVYSVLVILHIWKHINKICEEVTSLLKLLIE